MEWPITVGLHSVDTTQPTASQKRVPRETHGTRSTTDRKYSKHPKIFSVHCYWVWMANRLYQGRNFDLLLFGDRNG